MGFRPFLAGYIYAERGKCFSCSTIMYDLVIFLAGFLVVGVSNPKSGKGRHWRVRWKVEARQGYGGKFF
jgi:hypothetical protein